jgi:hypothetical protein
MSLIMMNLRDGEVHVLSSIINLGRLNSIIYSGRRDEVTPLTFGKPSDYLRHISILGFQIFLPTLQLMKIFLLGEHSHDHHSFGVSVQINGFIKKTNFGFGCISNME